MTSDKMSIAQGLVAARRRDQDAELERSVRDASQRRQKASGGGRGGGRGRSGSPDARAAASPRLAASAGLPPEELLASVRDAIVQSGRRPWWEDADATVDAHASLVGKDLRQAALHSFGDHAQLSAATRSLLRRQARFEPATADDGGDGVLDALGGSVAASGLSASAHAATNRLNMGLPAAASPVAGGARRETRPLRQPIAAEDVALGLQAQLQRSRTRALVDRSLRPPGS